MKYTKQRKLVAAYFILCLCLLFALSAAQAFDASQASHTTLYTNTIDSKGLAKIDVATNLQLQGNLDIGDTNPAETARVDIDGTLKAKGLKLGSQTISSWDEAGAFIKSGGIAFFLGDKVGIGTTLPATKLEILGTDPQLRVSGRADKTSIQLAKGGAVEWEMGSGQSPTQRDYFIGEIGMPHITIQKGTGNIGIGTTLPSNRLEVFGGGFKVNLGEEILEFSNTNVAGLEIRDLDADAPFVDLSNDPTSDFDARIQLTGDDTLTVQGATLNVLGNVKASGFALGGRTITNWNDAGAFTRNGVNAYFTTGNVGIGTQTPSVTLDVNGVIKANSLIGPAADRIQLQIESAKTWSEGGANIYRSTGNVGIGTPISSAKLHIKTDPGVPFIVESTRVAGGFVYQDFLQSGTRKWRLGSDATDNRLEIQPSGAATGLTLTQAGTVGIGTTDPKATLDVLGTVVFRGPLQGTNSASSLELKATDNVKFWHIGYRGSNTPTEGSLDFWYYGGRSGNQPIWRVPLSISPQGLVGIGTIIPTEKLTLYQGDLAIEGKANIFNSGLSFKDGDSRLGKIFIERGEGISSNTLDLVVQVSKTGTGNTFIPLEALRIQHNTGNVGIGTMPGTNTKLHVSGTTRIDGQLQLVPSGDGSDDDGWTITTGNAGWKSTRGGGWYMSDSTWIRSFGDKNIFQNTGILRTDGTLQVGSNGNRFIVKGSRVGIGQTEPAATLDVNGNIFQRGSNLHADYVFEDDYVLESIEEHSSYMWENKHMKAIPPLERDSQGNQIVDVGQQRRGILEELEKAHVYIEQLNNDLKIIKAQTAALLEGVEPLEGSK